MHKSAHSSAPARSAAASAQDTPLAVLQLKRDLAAAPPQAQEQPKAPQSGGRPLPAALQQQMEASLQADFSGVRVQEGPHVSALGALAYTQGDQLHFAPGHYQPETKRGQQLIGHELAHVVQQRAGRVAPEQPVQGSGLAVNQDASLEAEADAAGLAAAQGAEAKVSGAASGGGAQAATSQSAVVQFYKPIAHANYALNQDINDQHDPFTSQDNDPVLRQPAPLDPLSAQIRFARQAEANPNLLVSEDDTLAIQDTTKEPKEFYAAPNVLLQANAALQARGSMFRLAHTGHSIDLGHGPALTRVQPHRDGDTVPAAAGEFADFVYHRCINLAARGMGKETATNYRLEAILEGNGQRNTAPINSTGTESEHVNRLAEYVGNNANGDQANALNAIGGNHNPVSGQNYGTQSRHGGRDNTAQNLGINQHAKAQVGEGYGTYSVDSGVGKTDFSTTDIHGAPVVRGFMWGYHYAAVVASSLDQQDTITLENYNRADDTTALLNQLAQSLFNTFVNAADQLAAPMPGANDSRSEQADKYKAIYLKAEELRGTAALQAEQNYNNAIKEESGKAWYFAIQGPQAGQSFHEKAVASGYYANPLTVRVARPDFELAREEYAGLLAQIPNIAAVAQHHPTFALYAPQRMQARGAITQSLDRAAAQLAFQQHRATLLNAQLDLYHTVASEAAVAAGLIPQVPPRPLGANATLNAIRDLQQQLIARAIQTRRASRQQRLQQHATTLQQVHDALNNLIQWTVNH